MNQDAAQHGEELLSLYRDYLRLEKNMTSNTVEAYTDDVGKLLLYLKDAGLQPESVKLENLEHFAAGLHDIGITPRSQARILSGVRSFYKFLLMDRRIDALPTELLPSPKIGEHLPEVLSVEEIDRIISGIDLSEKEGQRNRAIIEMLYSCGLRVSELCNLLISDIWRDEGFVKVMGKGRKERFVPISGRALRELSLWEECRCHINIRPGNEDYVFLSFKRGRKLSHHGVSHSESSGRKRGYNKGDKPPHIPPFVCHPPSRGRCKPTRHSGNARTRKHSHYGNIHTPRQQPAERRNSAPPPARVCQTTVCRQLRPIRNTFFGNLQTLSATPQKT